MSVKWTTVKADGTRVEHSSEHDFQNSIDGHLCRILTYYGVPFELPLTPQCRKHAAELMKFGTWPDKGCG